MIHNYILWMDYISILPTYLLGQKNYFPIMSIFLFE